MKKIALVLASSVVLTSCSLLGTDTTVSPMVDAPSKTTSDSGVSSLESASKDTVKSGDTVGVDYVGRLEDGTVFDSSIEEYAKKTKNYAANSGRAYEPLSFTVGAGQMIKGFDAGVVGMKLGEKKTLTIAPADAYGEAYKEETAPKQYFQDVFTQDVPLDNFKDVITQTVPKSALGDKAEGLEVGKTIDAGNIKAKVTKIEGDNITVDIENKQNPFYGKKLVVGLKGTFEDNTVTIKKIAGDNVTLEINNKSNPFYGKKITEGLSAKTKDGQTITIAKIDDKNVTVRIPNTHELAGKTLIFDVEIKSIK